MSLGCFTLLFDADHETAIRAGTFNPLVVCRNQKPKKAFDKLCKLASSGIWFAVEPHPLILDADGVPGLDIIFANENSSPQDGQWLVSGSQYLDLPSGELTIAYEDEFFEDLDWHADEFPTYKVANPKLESLDNSEFCDATSYVIPVAPGFYLGHAYTRDLENDSSSDGRHADLAIVLVPTQRPKSFKTVSPCLSYAG